jgi:type I restriction enzyme M protein
MNYILDDDIDRIVNAYVERKNIDKFCYIAEMKDIEENDYNLNIPRYVNTLIEKEPIDISKLRADMEKHIEESKSLDEELSGYFKQLGL